MGKRELLDHVLRLFLGYDGQTWLADPSHGVAQHRLRCCVEPANAQALRDQS
jgi:hypothetical protein